MPCQLDCLSTYGCGSPIEITQGAIYAPFMKLTFAGGQMLTVGNASAPPDNHATISSLTYGFDSTTGFGADIEIIDQGGVMYRRIINALNKTISFAAREASNTELEFGWVITDCEGNTRLETSKNITGKSIHGFFLECEQNYEGGIVKLKVKLRGVMARAHDVVHDGTEGDEDDKIDLKEALTRLFTEHEPTFPGIRFEGVTEGSELEFKNRDGGPEGPKAAWPMSQQNPLATARTWLSSVSSEAGKGILITFDPDSGDIVFKEDPSEGNCCQSSYGTYVVNGGNCSPVLSFSPTIKWPKGMVPGGGAVTAGASTGDARHADIEPEIEIERAGTMTSPTIQQHEWMWRNPDEMAALDAEAYADHLRASGLALGGGLPGMEAELKIHGNPEFVSPLQIMGRTLALIVINPFHITSGDDGCQWLTTSNCNTLLSNKRYLILGVSHNISGGSFTTTFKLKLSLPNLDIDAHDVIGGSGCGTERLEGSEPLDATA